MTQPSIRTTCPYCGVGCGLLAQAAPDGGVVVRGDPAHPSNHGRLCSKGAALGETLGLEGRLLYPEIDGRRCDWDSALAAVARGLRETIRRHGPEAVAFYCSGQLLTEDYYVANKLMKGFIGAANIDTNSRLCMSSAVAGHKRAFGEDLVPGCYADLEEAELVVLAGSNAAWCHPVLYQRIVQAKAERPGLRTVVIDPRATPTGTGADLHLALRPGSDAVLWNGLLHYLRGNGALDFDFLEAHCAGYAEALRCAAVSSPSIPEVARKCGLPERAVADFFQWFLATEKVVSLFSQGVNQSSSGTDKVNAIINCHLASGRIARPGMGPFSLTGQPNAMGGREVGGLANQLAAHMELDDPVQRDLVQSFWRAPHLVQRPGYRAVELFEALERGAVRALWIMATNPVVSLPEAERVRRALARCELLIVSDCVRATDTTACADILLPALAWGEKSGTITNSERRISRQRAFLPPPGAARPDWWIVSRVAERMGYGDAFAYRTPADIFREHAALSACGNGGRRAFDLSALAGLSDADYAALAPVQWPVTAASPEGTARLGAERVCGAPGRKAQLVPITPREPVHAPDAAYPLILNTGRVRDHWHTMSRTGRSPRLSAHTSEPFFEIHPADAARAALSSGGLARVTSRWGSMLGRVVVSSGQRPGAVFAPIHWSDQYAREARVGAVVGPAVDPLSGQPECKHTPVRIAPYRPHWAGFAMARRRLAITGAAYQVEVCGTGHWRYELAGDEAPGDWAAWARRLLCTSDGGAEWVDYRDGATGEYRGARLVDGRLESCLFVGRMERLPPRAWLAGLFGAAVLSEHERAVLLAGRAAGRSCESGRIVCSCFNVGEAALDAAVRERGLVSVAEVGLELKAGTGCGSCIPELRAVIARCVDAHGAAARRPA